ncbi:PEP-CTERM sorting domain-containing protein [Denitrobaculum tricleocarpae]|nr:PEP-CTERM sorting domain-containing protein [Denitrobaculum tricleocarpae]
MAAAGALAGFEGFEAANIGPGGSATGSESWDSESDDSVFSPGGIVEGIRFSAFPGEQIAVAGGFSPNSTGVAIGPEDVASDLSINLFTEINAFGFDLFNLGESEQVFRIPIRDSFDEFVTEIEVTAGPLGSFFGVIDESLLLREFTIEGVNQDLAAELIDNVVFGIANPTAVPEPGTLALFGAGLLGFVAARRKRVGTPR